MLGTGAIGGDHNNAFVLTLPFHSSLNMKQKVLFFDYWTIGIHNFLPVAERLRERGVECLLVHLGSWQDTNIQTEEMIGGLKCRDIRAYGGDLRRALVEERPSAVLSLNTSMIMDRMLHRLCRSLDIRTVYMMHGVIATGADHADGVTVLNRYWSLPRRLAKVRKYAGLSIRYLKAVARDRPFELLHPGTYGHFVQLMVEPGAAFRHPWKHKDGCADEALVYASAYKDLMIEAFAYPVQRVTIVGNPNLDAVFALKKRHDADAMCMDYAHSIGVPSGRTFAVYLEDAIVEQGGSGWTENTRISEIEQVATATLEAGLDLVVKMHPGSQPDRVLTHFVGKPGVHIMLKADLPRLIGASVAVVGHVSTTLMIPIVFDKPLLVPTWSAGMERYKGSYVAENVAQPVSKPAALTAALCDLETVRNLLREGRIRFEERFIGPTDGGAWDRIVDHILSKGPVDI